MLLSLSWTYPEGNSSADKGRSVKGCPYKDKGEKSRTNAISRREATSNGWLSVADGMGVLIVLVITSTPRSGRPVLRPITLQPLMSPTMVQVWTEVISKGTWGRHCLVKALSTSASHNVLQRVQMESLSIEFSIF